MLEKRRAKQLGIGECSLTVLPTQLYGFQCVTHKRARAGQHVHYTTSHRLSLSQASEFAAARREK